MELEELQQVCEEGRNVRATRLECLLPLTAPDSFVAPSDAEVSAEKLTYNKSVHGTDGM
jgi:hypothetical protein